MHLEPPDLRLSRRYRRYPQPLLAQVKLGQFQSMVNGMYPPRSVLEHLLICHSGGNGWTGGKFFQ
jgi:hypothetical protein